MTNASHGSGSSHSGQPARPKSMRVGWIQRAFGWNSHANLDAIEAGIRDLAQRGAQVVVLPELHNTPYFCVTEELAHFDLAESIPGPTTQRLGALASELSTVIVASLFERRAAGLYHNTAVVLDADGSIAGIYRKMHIPDDPGYSEKFYFTPGDLGFGAIATRAGRLGVLVCWDQWYPEAARLTAMTGADVLLYPTAIGFHPADTPSEQARQRDAWVTIQRAHSIANGISVISVNRIGFEPDPSGRTQGAEFWGSSFATDSMGQILAQSPSDEDHLGLVDIDLAQAEMDRRVWPFFRDRRMDAYSDLTRRWRDQEGGQ